MTDVKKVLEFLSMGPQLSWAEIEKFLAPSDFLLPFPFPSPSTFYNRKNITLWINCKKFFSKDSEFDNILYNFKASKTCGLSSISLASFNLMYQTVGDEKHIKFRRRDSQRALWEWKYCPEPGATVVYSDDELMKKMFQR